MCQAQGEKTWSVPVLGSEQVFGNSLPTGGPTVNLMCEFYFLVAPLKTSRKEQLKNIVSNPDSFPRGKYENY